MGYVVTAGYVTVETAAPGAGRARIDIPAGQPLPDDVPAEDVERLLGLGHIGEVLDDPEVEPAPKRSPKRSAR